MDNPLSFMGPLGILLFLAVTITLAVFLFFLPFFVYGIYRRSVQVSERMSQITARLDLLVKNTRVSADFFKARLTKADPDDE